jgi:hypothetical protein
MTWVLYALLLTKFLDLPLLFSPSIMYNCLDNIMLVAQDLMQVIFEDMDPSLAEVHVGEWRNLTGKDDRDNNHASTT